MFQTLHTSKPNFAMTSQRLRPARHVLRSLTLAALFTAATPGPLFAQSDAQIREDIRFARGVAEEWGFVDLADGILADIEAGNVPAAMSEELGLVKCDLYRAAAVKSRDADKRNDLLQRAIDAYAAFCESNQYSEQLPQAELGLVNTSSVYARSLELAIEEAIGAEAEELAEKRREVLTKAVAKTGDLISNLENSDDQSEAKKRQLYELMLQRAQMLYDVARTQDEGQFNFEQALMTCENLVFKAGEGTPHCLRAYNLMGRTYAAMQSWEEAAAFFQAVIDVAIPADLDEWKEIVKELELQQSDKEQRWLFVELATPGLVEAFASSGEMGEACRFALHLYNTQKREGFEFSRELGYPALLVGAGILLDSGGWVGGNLSSGETAWFQSEEEAKDAGASRRNRIACADLALKIAQQVNTENQGNILQVRAQKLISQIITRPGVEVQPAVLYEAAEGHYNEGNNVEAIKGLKQVLAALDDSDEATRLELAPKTYYYLGRSYQQLDRHLEAIMAFKEGVTSYRGDPEYDAYSAQQLYKSADRMRKTIRDDDQITAMFNEAETIAAQLSEANKDEILFRQAEKLRGERKFAEAIPKYEQIEKLANDYEKALVAIGECKFRLGETEAAEAKFKDYVESYVTDEENSVENSPVRAARRSDALAKARFYRTLIAFQAADKTGFDQGLWDRVIELGADYPDLHPTQDTHAPWTMRMVMNAHVSKVNVTAARETHRRLSEDYPDSSFTPVASLELHGALKKLRKEAEDKGETESAAQTLREMAELLEFANKNAVKFSFKNTRTEASHWYDLGEYEKAEKVMRALMERPTDDPNEQNTINNYVRPELAQALLAQREVAEALEILRELMDGGGRPTKQVVLSYCRGVSGWIEGAAGKINIIPGAAADAAELDKVIETLNAISNSKEVDKWTCDWYGYKFQLAYTYYVYATADWGPQDQRKKDSARRQLDVLVQEFGANFEGIETACEEADDELKARFGDDVLRRRFVWLWREVQ
ncbi:MAG: tetratricopeptide repeat protein [Planctomycetes bacterium]|nr:tetratricopeptide repeat protein [Planctomycetota bacterium]